ncbi:hypothetical protein [Neomegalonema sp.]|uniref:hypothetical protein n=1 Tax=Neomegalonema sp. TaxID=2039713 RepID=UPI002631E97B|nr:hypothetical protein [Neomegalonema sp.]MDD2870319.1 hypothetical protein [Neomegalonema sp.]
MNVLQGMWSSFARSLQTPQGFGFGGFRPGLNLNFGGFSPNFASGFGGARPGLSVSVNFGGPSAANFNRFGFGGAAAPWSAGGQGLQGSVSFGGGQSSVVLCVKSPGSPCTCKAGKK